MTRSLPRFFQTFHWLNALVSPGNKHFATRAGSRNLKFNAVANDDIARHIAKYGAHEPELTAWIDRFLGAQNTDGIVIDVGANIGWHTLHVATHACVSAVLACEADATNQHLLQKNIFDNALENVIVAPWAISDTRRIVEFHHYKKSNLGRHSVVTDFGFGSLRVPAFSLDETIEMFGVDNRPIHLIKIDVEGYEYAVLEGAVNALARASAVVLEYSPEIMTRANIKSRRVIDPLFDKKFKPFRLLNDTLQALSHSEILSIEYQTDIVWLSDASI